ncbi:MAG: TonB-dependent receptor [Rhodothermales bacterium]
MISGYVSDDSDGQAIELVNVALLLDGELITGGVTNQDGIYVLRRIPPGTYTLIVSFLGYERFTKEITFVAERNVTQNVRLAPDAETMDEVLVQSERLSGAARVTAGQQTIRPEDLELIPSPDVTPDLINYLNTLPGIVSLGDRGGQLFVRGGEPTQNLVQIDRMLIYQPFHVLGFYSAFPGDILSKSDIYAGGFGSRFGGRISSVLDILTRNGNKRRLAGAVGISPFVSSIRLEGPLIPNRVSLLASVRESFIEQGAARYIDSPMPFAFGDMFAKLHAEVNSRSRFSVSYLRTHDRGTLNETFDEGVIPEEVRWKNEAIGFRWVVLPRFISATTEFNVTHSRLNTQQGPAEAPSRRSAIKSTHVGVDVSFQGVRVDGHAGVSIRLNSLDSQLDGLFQNIELKRVTLDEAAQYLELNFKWPGGLNIEPGVRVQFYQVSIDPKVEPRLRIVWNRGKHQLSGAAGIYNQEILGVTDRRDAASVFTAWTSIPQPTPRNLARDIRAGKLPGAFHAIAGYRLTPNDGFELSLEGFHKDITNLFVPEWSAFPEFTSSVQPATGQSQGFDFRAELRRPSFYAAVNYGYSNTRYKAEQFQLELWYGEERLQYRPPHDRRHQINVIAHWELWGMDMNAKWELGSGLPFSRALGFDAFVLVDDLIDVREIPGAKRVIYERPFNGVLPAYHRMDASISKSWQLKRAKFTLQGSVINIYNRKNLFYLDIFTLQRVDQLPIVPTLGLQLSFE